MRASILWTCAVLESVAAAGEPAGPAALPAGVEIRGPEKPSAIEVFALAELRAAIGRAAASQGGRVQKLSIVLGRGSDNAEVKKLLDAGFTKPETRKEGYALKYDQAKGLVLVAGADDNGTLYGTMDLIHYRLRDVLAGKAADFDLHDAPKISLRGCWHWSCVISNYEMFLDEMGRWKMNFFAPWIFGPGGGGTAQPAPKDRPPVTETKFRFASLPQKEAKALQEYAAARGITVAWGWSWGWGSLNWSDPKDIQWHEDMIVQTFKDEFAPVKPKAIYFQTHTEYGAGAKFGKEAVELVNKAARRIWEIQPDLEVFFNLHMQFVNHAEHMRNLDPRIHVMYEDNDSAVHYVIAPPGPKAAENNRMLNAIRGDREKMGYVYKDLCLGGQVRKEQINLVSADTLRQSAIGGAWRFVASAETGWRKYFNLWLPILRDLAHSKVERTHIVMIFGQLSELYSWWPVCLVAEAVWDPDRDGAELMRMADECADVTRPSKPGPMPPPEQLVKHEAVGKTVTLKSPFPDGSDRGGAASLLGPAGLVDGSLARDTKLDWANDPFWNGMKPASSFEAVVDMGGEVHIREISTRYLQQMNTRRRAWAPESVEYAVSGDGKEFTVVATVREPKIAEDGKVPSKVTGIFTFKAAGLTSKGRYVRVKPTMPARSADSPAGVPADAWLWIDEIVVNPAK